MYILNKYCSRQVVDKFFVNASEIKDDDFFEDEDDEPIEVPSENTEE